MSKRDHYKGTPKTTGAVVGYNGRLKALNKVNKINPNLISSEYITSLRKPVGDYRVIYARSSGDDKNGDGSLEKPYRTFRRSVDDLPVFANGTAWYIDITGIGEEVLEEHIKMPPFVSNVSYEILIGGPVAPDYNFIRAALNIVAEPTVIETANITSTFTAPTTEMYRVVDTSKNWTAGEFRGKFIRGSGFAELGTIYDNTSDTLYTTSPTDFTSPIYIFEPSASLKLGPVGGNGYAFELGGYTCSVSIMGIKFDCNQPTGMWSFGGTGNTNFISIEMCHFAKMFSMQFGGNYLMDYNVQEGTFTQNGSNTTYRNSYFKGGVYNVHGTGGMGLNFWFSNRFENMTGLGHGGNSGPEIGFSYDNCSISGAVGSAIVYRGGSSCALTKIEILDSSGSAVAVTGPGLFRMTTVSGSGNAAYGLSVTSGAQVQVNSGVTVSGSSGSLKVGSKAEESWESFRNGTTNSIDIAGDDATLSRVFLV